MAKASIARVQRCRVVFSYQPVNEDELELKEGEVVQIQEEIEKGWYEGRINDKVGAFPSNFVEMLEEDEVEEDKSNESKTEKTTEECESDSGEERAVVDYPYKPIDSDELELIEGDIVTILDKDVEKGWWKGKVKGKVGVLPNNFVSLLSKRKKSSVSEDRKKSKKTKEEITLLKKKSLSEEHIQKTSSLASNIEPTPRLMHLTRMRPKGPTTRRPPTRNSLCPSTAETQEHSHMIAVPETSEEKELDEFKPKMRGPRGFREDLNRILARQSIADPTLFVKKFVDQTTEEPSNEEVNEKPVKEVKETPVKEFKEKPKRFKKNNQKPTPEGSTERKDREKNDKKDKKEKPSVPAAPKPKVGVCSLFSGKSKQKDSGPKPKLGVSALAKDEINSKHNSKNSAQDFPGKSNPVKPTNLNQDQLPSLILPNSPRNDSGPMESVSTPEVTKEERGRRKSTKKTPAPRPPVPDSAANEKNKTVEAKEEQSRGSRIKVADYENKEIPPETNKINSELDLKQLTEDLKVQLEEQNQKRLEDNEAHQAELKNLYKELDEIKQKVKEVQADVRGLKKMSD